MGQGAATLTTACTGPAHHTLFSLRFSAKRFKKRAPRRFEPSTSQAMYERANHPGQHPLRDSLFFYSIFNNDHFFCARFQLVWFFWPFFFFFQFRELFLSLWIFFVSVNFFSNLLNSWTFQNNENFLNLMNFSSRLTFFQIWWTFSYFDENLSKFVNFPTKRRVQKLSLPTTPPLLFWIIYSNFLVFFVFI